jgi:tetratricopeptide (TPR) repeat protein
VPAETPRIAELRRRIQTDPASIAFAQLAEEYRRAGQYHDAVQVCRTGLARHPAYLSARVTLGRALIELDQLDEAAQTFELVLRSAPDNLAAIRGMAEIHQRRGAMQYALQYYTQALALARFDPDLEESVDRITRELRAVEAQAIERHQPRPPANDVLDFDALLSELGASDATPPPAAERLLAQAPLATESLPADALLPEAAGSDLPDDPFRALEEQLRALRADAYLEVADEASDQPLERFAQELEDWLDVLASERKSLARPTR